MKGTLSAENQTAADEDAVEIVAKVPQGVELNKPFRNPSGSNRKFSVYVKNDEGNTVKVQFGDPNMEIRRDDKQARENFRNRFQCDTNPGPKWKPKYWSCRMWDEESVTEILNAKMERISASFAAESFDGNAPDSIVFMPAGKHEIQASKGGKPALVKVSVTQTAAERFDAQLKQAIADADAGKSSRPFVDFQHEGGRAAAIPTGFSWDSSKGIMLHLDWTASGRAAVEGRDFSYFSPEWLQNGEEPSGLALPGPVGGLVNTPAFQTIPKIAAELSNNPKMDLTKLLELLKEYGFELSPESPETEIMDALKSAMTQKKMAAEKTAELETVKAAATQHESDLATVRASLASITAELDTVKAEHAAELEKVKASVNVEVAKIVKAAALPAPVKATTMQSPEEKPTVKRASFDRMSHPERDKFIKAGGKITD